MLEKSNLKSERYVRERGYGEINVGKRKFRKKKEILERETLGNKF